MAASDAAALQGAVANDKAAAMSATSGLRYRRLLLKLSGEALMGKAAYGIDVPVVQRISGEIKEAMAAPSITLRSRASTSA